MGGGGGGGGGGVQPATQGAASAGAATPSVTIDRGAPLDARQIRAVNRLSHDVAVVISDLTLRYQATTNAETI